MSKAGMEWHFSINSLYNGLMIEKYHVLKQAPVHCSSTWATHAASSSRILLQSLNAHMLPTDFNGWLIGWEDVNVLFKKWPVHPSIQSQCWLFLLKVNVKKEKRLDWSQIFPVKIFILMSAKPAESHLMQHRKHDRAIDSSLGLQFFDGSSVVVRRAPATPMKYWC